MSESGKSDKAEKQQSSDLRAAAHAVTFPMGLYMFSVKNASPVPVPKAGNMLFPALHITGGPGMAPNAVEFVGSPKAAGTWLYNTGDTLIVKVGEAGATLILSSVRAEGTQPLDVKVDRLDGQPASTSPQVAVPNAPAVTAAQSAQAPGLKLQASTHLRSYGDVEFSGSEWIGRVGSKAWIESLSIVPLEQLTANDLEYKGLAANGFETPWLSDGAVCGTPGKGIPLIGFAIRLKTGPAALYDCEYTASFVSGAKVGPMRGGVPCRSRTASDPLEALQLRIVRRAAPPATGVARPADTAAPGPKFSKFREEGPAVAAETPTRIKPAPAPVPKKQVTKSPPKKPIAKGKVAKPAAKPAVTKKPVKTKLAPAATSKKVVPKRRPKRK